MQVERVSIGLAQRNQRFLVSIRIDAENFSCRFIADV